MSRLNLYIFKKARKMDRIDKEILMNLFKSEEPSIYKLADSIRWSSYPTVLRHINDLKTEGYLEESEALRKDGKRDQRDTRIMNLTNKGLAYLLQDGNLSDDDLVDVGLSVMEKRLKEDDPFRPIMAEVFLESLQTIRPRFNLQFWDEDWFEKMLNESYNEALHKAMKRHKNELEEKGLWRGELEKDPDGVITMTIHKRESP